MISTAANTRVPMSSRLIVIVVIIALAVSDSVGAAGTSNTEVKEIVSDSSVIAESALSSADLARAQLWDLSVVEWHRYQQLMQGIRGSISPSTISPIEVLGIHARDDAERRQYAEAWVHAMREDVDRILAFQHAYDAAGKRLYPNELMIDIDRLPGKHEQADAFRATDRILFFSRPNCPDCDALMTKLLAQIDDVSGIDIFLTALAPGDDAAVRAWASTHQINPEWVRSRQITLNHDVGVLDKLTSGQGKVPTILRRRGEKLSQVRGSDL